MNRLSLLFLFFSGCLCLVFSASTGRDAVKEDLESESNAESDELKDGTKGWGFPFFPPGIPSVFGNSSVAGGVDGLFALNNSTLVATSPPGSDVGTMAQLSSSAMYFAVPFNETEHNVDGSNTYGENTAGFNVFTQEDTQASAIGEFIQFSNHGASFAAGIGESNATGSTFNPGPMPVPIGPGWGIGSGWKKPVPAVNLPNSKN